MPSQHAAEAVPPAASAVRPFRERALLILWPAGAITHLLEGPGPGPHR